jgi:hypothetical protein
MGLFRRKRADDEREHRCPVCAEPVPPEALQCMMCGIDLRPLRSHGAVDSRGAGADALAADRR